MSNNKAKKTKLRRDISNEPLLNNPHKKDTSEISVDAEIFNEIPALGKVEGDLDTVNKDKVVPTKNQAFEESDVNSKLTQIFAEIDSHRKSKLGSKLDESATKNNQTSGVIFLDEHGNRCTKQGFIEDCLIAADDLDNSVSDESNDFEEEASDDFWDEIFDELDDLSEDDSDIDKNPKINDHAKIAKSSKKQCATEKDNSDKKCVADQERIELAKSINDKVCEALQGANFYKDVVMCAPSQLTRLEKLKQDFPNMLEPTDMIIRKIKRGLIQKSQVDVESIALNGSPGTGKTTWCHALGKTLGIPVFDISVATLSGPADLVGTDQKYSLSNIGLLTDIILRQSDTFQAIVILDDLCSAYSGYDAKYSIMPVLLGLLERHQARSFTDQFLKEKIDLSGITFVATTNNIEHLPQNIRSRFLEFEISPPSGDNFALVVNNIYAKALKDDNLDAWFSTSLDDLIIHQLKSASLREVRRMIQLAIDNSLERHNYQSIKNDTISLHIIDFDRFTKSQHSHLPPSTLLH